MDADPTTVAGDVAPFAPDAVNVGVRHVQLGPTEWVATLVVTGYPRDVHAGWLAPFTQHPGRVDVCLHVTPIDPATAASRLRRQLARLESGRRSDTEHGRLPDPHTDAATEDAYALADRVARGEGRLFQVGLSLTVHAASPTELAERVADVRALAASMLIDAHPTPYRALHGWVTGLPLGLDKLGQHRTFDTDALAAAFPFASPELPAPDLAHSTDATNGTEVAGTAGRGAAPPRAAAFGAAAAPARWGALRLQPRARDRWCSGTGSPATTTTPSSSAGPGRASPTWSNSSCCARCTAASRPTSSTPKTNTPASPTPSAAP